MGSLKIISVLKKHKDEIQVSVSVIGVLIAAVIGIFSIFGHIKTVELIDSQIDDLEPRGRICAVFGREMAWDWCFSSNTLDTLSYFHKKMANEPEYTTFLTVQIFNTGDRTLELYDVRYDTNCSLGMRSSINASLENTLIAPYESKTYKMPIQLMLKKDQKVKDIETPCTIRANVATNFGNYYPSITFTHHEQ